VIRENSPIENIAALPFNTLWSPMRERPATTAVLGLPLRESQASAALFTQLFAVRANFARFSREVIPERIGWMHSLMGAAILFAFYSSASRSSANPLRRPFAPSPEQWAFGWRPEIGRRK